jgi:hypothetical protein
MFSQALAVVLQFAFFSLAMAAPMETAQHGNTWQYGTGGGVIGFIVLILDILVISMSLSHMSIFTFASVLLPSSSKSGREVSVPLDS